MNPERIHTYFVAAGVPPGGTRAGIHRGPAESVTEAPSAHSLRRDAASGSRAHRRGSGVNAALLSQVCALLLAPVAEGASTVDLFNNATQAYRIGEYSEAARMFRASASRQPAPGTLRNLGNAEWQLGRVGEAILAWEQSQWLKPGDAVRDNLRFARQTMQIEAPEFRWYEIASTWLPVDGWGWIAGGCLTVAVGMITLPSVLRWPKAGWHQAVAVFALAGFLLCLPALAGVATRTRIGIVLEKDIPLRLTPTQEAQGITRLAAGEPGRLLRERGGYLFIRTSRATGWVKRGQFGLVCAK